MKGTTENTASIDTKRHAEHQQDAVDANTQWHDDHDNLMAVEQLDETDLDMVEVSELPLLSDLPEPANAADTEVDIELVTADLDLEEIEMDSASELSVEDGEGDLASMAEITETDESAENSVDIEVIDVDPDTELELDSIDVIAADDPVPVSDDADMALAEEMTDTDATAEESESTDTTEDESESESDEEQSGEDDLASLVDVSETEESGDEGVDIDVVDIDPDAELSMVDAEVAAEDEPALESDDVDTATVEETTDSEAPVEDSEPTDTTEVDSESDDVEDDEETTAMAEESEPEEDDHDDTTDMESPDESDTAFEHPMDHHPSMIVVDAMFDLAASVQNLADAMHTFMDTQGVIDDNGLPPLWNPIGIDDHPFMPGPEPIGSHDDHDMHGHGPGMPHVWNPIGTPDDPDSDGGVSALPLWTHPAPPAFHLINQLADAMAAFARPEDKGSDMIDLSDNGGSADLGLDAMG